MSTGQNSVGDEIRAVSFPLPPAIATQLEARDAVRCHYRGVLARMGSGVDLRFTLDGNLVGDIGEAIAAELFGVTLVETKSTEGIDGYAPDGRSVQIKATGTRRGPAFRPTATRADHLLFFCLDFAGANGTVAFNGPERDVTRFLPDGQYEQRMVSRVRLRAANALVSPTDRPPRCDGVRRSRYAWYKRLVAFDQGRDGPLTGNGEDEGLSGGSFYDGRTVLLPDVGRLRAGDILLTRTTPLAGFVEGTQSRKIRMKTGGSFSHAMICSEPPTMVEAIGTGVSTLSLSRCYAHGWESVCVLRHPDAALAQEAASAAQLQVGRDYSVRRALRAAFPEIADRMSDLGTFCSALVAQSYVGAGDALFARVPIELTTPAIIENIDGLEEVTRSVFHEGLAPRNIGRMVPLDAHSDPSPSARQTKASGKYAKALMADAERVVAALPSPVELLPTHYGMLDVVMKGMDALAAGVGAATLPEDVRRLDADLAGMISSGELAAVHAALEEIEGEELQQAVASSFDATPDIDRRAMRSQLKTMRRTVEVRSRSVRAMADWNVGGRSAAVTAYVDLERMAIASIVRREAVFVEILDRLR